MESNFFEILGLEFWGTSLEFEEGWVCMGARRFPTRMEPSCPRCHAGFRDVLYKVFHPGAPDAVVEVCRECASLLCGDFRPLPEPLETWVWLDLLSLRSLPVSGRLEEASMPAAFLEVEGVDLPAGPSSVFSEENLLEFDFNSLEGKGWKVSAKGNLYSHQRDFHAVIFEDSHGGGYKVMLDGEVGQCFYRDPVVASLAVMEAVGELLSRGVIPQRLHETSGGFPVSVQREMIMR